MRIHCSYAVLSGVKVKLLTFILFSGFGLVVLAVVAALLAVLSGVFVFIYPLPPGAGKVSDEIVSRPS